MTIKRYKKCLSTPEIPVVDWHPADIKAALNKAGFSLSLLAENLGYKGHSVLSRALTVSAPKSELAIANALAIHPKIIWPSRYNEDGSRKITGARLLESSGRARNLLAKSEGEQA